MREMGRVSLQKALELTALIALKEPHRRSRVAARWLLRFLEEHDTATIEEGVLAGSALTTLGTAGRNSAIAVLRDMTEKRLPGVVVGRIGVSVWGVRIAVWPVLGAYRRRAIVSSSGTREAVGPVDRSGGYRIVGRESGTAERRSP